MAGALLLALLVLAGCGSSDNAGEAAAAQPEATAQTEVPEQAASPTPAPTATSTPEPTPTNTPMPTPTPTPKPLPLDSEGPFTFAELAAEWANDVALSDSPALADVWTAADEVEPGRHVVVTDDVMLAAVTDGDGLVTRLEITAADGGAVRNGDDLVGPVVDAISAAVWALDPNAPASVGPALEAITEPERRREQWVGSRRDVWELTEGQVTMHIGVASSAAQLESEVVDVFGPPELLDDNRRVIGQQQTWTLEWWGCATDAGPCVVYVDSELNWISLLQNQVELERTENGIAGSNTVELTDNCNRSDWPDLTRRWRVDYDLTVEDDRITAGTVTINALDERVQEANRLCLSYSTVVDLS